MGKIFDVMEIMKLLPHRYPFILVDRIIEFVKGEKIIALKNVTINEPFFMGHFPGTPIMPGVLIVEAMAQAGGILYLASNQEERPGELVYFMGMDKVKFRKPVIPGDQLIFEIKIINIRLKAVKMAGIATVDGILVAEAELMAAFGEKP
ncbi:MAG: 3-hydroxyacyl-ACP dehydratase FabZ [Proteobacteria bacterium]|nr:3-hydroxyacyl-ACP dehydratase FabZ [Pseudomonadota bacterium]